MTSPETDAGKIPDYPEGATPCLAHRELLHPLFKALPHGISELTFAGIYLFRHAHQYRLSRMSEGTVVILGRDENHPFFICPFDLPGNRELSRLFHDHVTLKCADQDQARMLQDRGYYAFEDRDHFDYLYSRENLAELKGRKYHKKRNLIKAFINHHDYEGRPLLDEYLPHALEILDAWRLERGSDGDYRAAREALEKCHPLQLCGGIYYVDETPAAYTLGEELACGTSFVIHFEKALSRYKGIYQFVNQAFAAIITEHYQTINREQDLGNPGLRQAKMSYKPSGFVEKYRVTAKEHHDPATPS